MKKLEPPIIYQHLIVFLLGLVTPIGLFLFRDLDDNRLTSWSWAFGEANLLNNAFILIAALFASWFFCRISFSNKGKPLLLFVTSFAAASFFWSEPEVIIDGARYFTQAKHLEIYGVGYFFEQWGKEIFAWTDLPLIPFLYGVVFKLFGEQRVLIQIINTIFYSLTVVLTYQLGKALWDEEVGLWGGVLLLGFPYLYTQVPLFLVDVPTMFFFMLAVVTCYQALEEGGVGRIVTAASSLFLIFYVKYSSWMMLIIIPVICAYFLISKPVQTIKRSGALALFSLVIIGIVFLMYGDVISGQLNFLVEYQKPGLKRWSESYLSTFLFQIHPFITVAALFSFVVAIRKMDLRFLIISFLFLLFLFLQVKRIRYTLPIFPMFALMAAYGMGVIQNRTLKKHIVFSIVSTSFVVAFFGFLPLLKSLGVQNLQAAGRYLNTLPLTGVEVVSIAGENVVANPDLGVPALDIYTDKKLYYEKRQRSPELLEKARTSSLRFTWEYPLPRYYWAKGSVPLEGLVVIKDAPDRPMSEAVEYKISMYPFRKTFEQSSNIFQHQTFVTVYHK